jgi:small-conductance mechanosensitive channel/CRP-like cAMP-binding protein
MSLSADPQNRSKDHRKPKDEPYEPVHCERNVAVVGESDSGADDPRREDRAARSRLYHRNGKLLFGSPLKGMKRITVPLAISVLLLGVYGAFDQLEPDRLSPAFATGLLAILLAGFSVALVRAIGFVLFDVVFQRRKGREAPALLRRPLSMVLYLVCFLAIYRVVIGQNIGFEIVATSTVVSVIIGLALQDTLGNLFAGLSIHIEQPFHILDAIRIGNMLGRVESVTWRSTTIRTNDNSAIVFPNSKVAREPLEVFRFKDLNRRILHIPAPYGIPPQKVITLLRNTVASIPTVAKEKTPIVRIGEFAESSIVYEVLYWIKDYMWVPDIDATIRQHAWYIYRRHDVDIPFPIRHLVFGQQDAAIGQAAAGYDNIIDQVEIFAPLTQQEKEAVRRAAIKAAYAPGELILRRGDPGDSMFVICRGLVEVQVAANDGAIQHLAQLEPGSFFGEMALLTGEPRTADVVALTEVETLEIRKGVLQQLLDENEQLAEALSRTLTERQMDLDQHVLSMPEEARRAQSRTLLGRIQRFFSLS